MATNNNSFQSSFMGQFMTGFGDPVMNQGRQMIKKIVWEVIKSNDFKNELSNYVRLEVEASKRNGTANTLSYDMLTRGNVNMQARMAASGYDVYGRTIIHGNSSTSNDSVYKRMKNKINYGRNNSTYSFNNTGSRSMV